MQGLADLAWALSVLCPSSLDHDYVEAWVQAAQPLLPRFKPQVGRGRGGGVYIAVAATLQATGGQGGGGGLHSCSCHTYTCVCGVVCGGVVGWGQLPGWPVQTLIRDRLMTKQVADD